MAEARPRFLSIPIEIRYMVYDLLYPSCPNGLVVAGEHRGALPASCAPCNATLPQIPLYVCKQMHHEIYKFLNTRNWRAVLNMDYYEAGPVLSYGRSCFRHAISAYVRIELKPREFSTTLEDRVKSLIQPVHARQNRARLFGEPMMSHFTVDLRAPRYMAASQVEILMLRIMGAIKEVGVRDVGKVKIKVRSESLNAHELLRVQHAAYVLRLSMEG